MGNFGAPATTLQKAQKVFKNGKKEEGKEGRKNCFLPALQKKVSFKNHVFNCSQFVINIDKQN